VLAFLTFSSVRNNGGDIPTFLWRMVPLCLHALITFIAALLIAQYSKATMGSEVQLLPLLLLSLTFKDLEILNIYYQYCHVLLCDFKVVACIHQIAFIMTTFLAMECGIFQSEINGRKLTQFILVALACSIYLGIAVPINYANDAYLTSSYVTSSMLRFFLYIFGGIGVFSILFGMFQENPSKETIFKSIGYILIITSHTMQAGNRNLIVSLVELSLHILGTVMLVCAAKSNRIWG